MCLLFFNIFDDCDKDEFRVVLVNNRDEYWARPTAQASFWSPSCISGLDLVPGREGGTWFGANCQGRIGCLVNILSQQVLSKQGRGHMVSDFLSKEDTIESCVEQVSSRKDAYNGFVLTLIELGKYRSKVTRVTNDQLADEAVLMLQPGADGLVYSVGNSRVKFPWQKVSCGEERFKQIVQGHRKVSAAKELKEELFKMMHDKHSGTLCGVDCEIKGPSHLGTTGDIKLAIRYWPDQQLQKQAEEWCQDDEDIQARASMFVWEPRNQYGTRTTTVLLIDGQGNCDYTEKTLQTPVDIACPKWSSVNFSFQLQFPDPL